FKDGNEGLHSSFFYTFLVQPITAEETTAITGIPEVARTIEGYNIPTPDIMEAYEPGDVRKDVSVGFVTAHGISYPYIKKYCHAHTQSGKTGDNWPVYRYAEVLLFIAEALNEQGKTEEALVYLNRVRSRALLPVSSASTQSDVREAIIKERRVELAFENKRWLDLVRTGS
ncbi:RagB/SusD domain protein, partial [human gut metagenome]